MRIIQKHQQGGFMYSQYTPQSTPIGALSWVAYGLANSQQQQAAEASGSSSSSKSSSSGDIGLLTKDMVKLLYENGLPNDVDKFLQSVDIFGKSIGGNPFASSESVNQETQYKQILSILPKLKLNKDQYDAALKEAQKNNTTGETAISPDGKVFVYNSEGGLTKKTVKQLSSKEIPLTVAELAQLRAYAPNLSFDNGTIAQTINNSISIRQVFKEIEAIVDKIGTTKDSKESFVRRNSSEQSKVQEGVQQLLGETADGIYKAHAESSTQKDKAAYALRYILETLPTNARVLLQDYARKNGLDLDKGPLQIIEDCITGRLDDETKLSLSYDKSASEALVTASGMSSEDMKNAQNINQAMMVASGDFGVHELQTITPGNDTYAYQVNAQILPSFQAANSNATIKAGKLSTLLGTSKVGGVLDKSAAHAGTQLIDPVQFERIYYDGLGGYNMELPFTVDEYGKVMPDWNVMQAYAEADKEIAALNNPTPQQINAIFKSKGLDNYFNADGTVNRSRFRRFMAIGVYGDTKAFKDPDDNQMFFVEVDDDSAEDAISEALGTQKNPLKLEGDLYKTVIYIPVFDSPTNAMIAGGTPLKTPLKSASQYGREEYQMNLQKQHNTQYTKSML